MSRKSDYPIFVSHNSCCKLRWCFDPVNHHEWNSSKHVCLQRWTVWLFTSVFSSVPSSPDWVIVGTWWMIQQRSSSSLFWIHFSIPQYPRKWTHCTGKQETFWNISNFLATTMFPFSGQSGTVMQAGHKKRSCCLGETEKIISNQECTN